MYTYMYICSPMPYLTASSTVRNISQYLRVQLGRGNQESTKYIRQNIQVRDTY